MSRLFSMISPYWLWAVLALPAAGMMAALTESPSPRVIHELLHPTGEFAARFMIIALMATPLAIIFKGWRGPRWLIKNRRYFGVAAFGYALSHTVLYLMDAESLARILGEARRLDHLDRLACVLHLCPPGRHLDGLLRSYHGDPMEGVAALGLRSCDLDACALGRPA